jgi:exosortase
MIQDQTNETSPHRGAPASMAIDDLRGQAAPTLLGIDPTTWFRIGIIFVLFVCLFWPNLRRLWYKTNPFTGEPNWGHAICIPLIGLYYLYVNREGLLNPSPSTPSARWDGIWLWGMLMTVLSLPLLFVRVLAPGILIPAAIGVVIVGAVLLALCVRKTGGQWIEKALEHSAGWFGGYVLLLGIALFGYAIWPGQNDFLKDFGMVLTLMGIVLALGGWEIMRIAWFPIAFLVCGIPWPGLLYSQVAEPLQHLAANVAVWTLQLTGVESFASGTKISISGHGGAWRTLNVAEACAGMRSLMTFISVGAAVAFLSHRPLWQKILITLSAIPIAIFCNVMRVSGQGLLDHYVSPQLSESFAHQFVGVIMLVPAFALILLVGWVMDQLFVEEVDRRHTTVAPKVIHRNDGPVVTPVAAPRSLAAIRAAKAASGSAPSGAKPRPQGIRPRPTYRPPEMPARPAKGETT